MEQLSGNGASSPYALYGTTSSVYDWLGDVISVTGPADFPTTAAGLNSAAQTTTTYDLLGRAVQMSDADLGSGWQYTYDPDGNLLSSVDARGTSGGGAVYASYDGLDRPLSRSVNSDGSNPYVSYGYDGTTGGNLGVGRLTSESFTGGTPSNPLSGGYAYTYDGRGQVTAWTQTTTGGTPYTLQTAYNDAGQPSSVTYSDGEVFSPGYNSDGWLTSATTVPAGGSQVNLLTNIGYSGVGGAAMHPTSASVGNGTYSYSATYDDDLRLSNVTESLSGGGTTLFSSSRTYDAVGNVATVATILAAGNDTQAFCYDEQNRLTWAGSTGTPPCTGTPITAGTLTSAQYTAGYSYDALNRLTTAPTLGSYSYGTTPVHGATSTTNSGSTVYSASYDAAGDMTCRAPSSATTCVGTPTGQQLQYDAERRVSHWQSAPGGSPTSSADYLYDGSGNRIEQVDTTGSTSTQVYYLFGGVEEVSSTGSTSTLTKYYSAGGLLIGESVGGTISYLASDGLGSVSEALSTSGTATAAQLYGPYGGVRYSSGTMPTAKGFTGQRADTISGLDYYGARYYDPVLGQFASADTKQGPNRFAYVADDPETLTDPTGHLRTCMEPPCGGGGGGGSGGGGGGGGCHSDGSCGCYTSCGGGSGGGGGSGSGSGSSGSGGGSGGGCNPDSPAASQACLAWAYQADKIRQKQLDALDSSADMKLIAGYLLVLLSDAANIITGDTLSRLEALLDLASTVVNSLLPLIGKEIQRHFSQFDDAYQQFAELASHLNGVLGIIQAAIGFVKQGNWLMQLSVNAALQIATGLEAPVPTIAMTFVKSFAPAITSYMDAGAHDLIRSGYDDLAQEQGENQMHIGDWCSQYGGGACGAAPSS